MATIDELFQDWPPNKELRVKISKDASRLPYSGDWFSPRVRGNWACNPAWCGIDESGEICYVRTNDDQWELWEEPKKKIKRWLWVNPNGVVHCWSESECDKLKMLTQCQKIPGTEVEMDE